MIYKNARVFTGNKFENCNFTVKNGVFSSIMSSIYQNQNAHSKDTIYSCKKSEIHNDDENDSKNEDYNKNYNDNESYNNNESNDYVDLSGYTVIPGLIDIHTHGIMGFDFSTATKEQMKHMSEYYVKNGTTSLLPTIVTVSEKYYKECLTNIVDNICKSSPFVGINLEGPFISSYKKGSHNVKYIKDINLEFMKKLWDLSKKNIKLLTVAPEKAGFSELANYAKDKFRLSMGHTSCDIETAIFAINMGVNHVTHLFNAMNPLKHREPSLVGAALNFPVIKELICDGVHIDKYVIKMLFRKYSDEICVISDSLSSCGLGDGEYTLGDMKVIVKNNKATLEDGTIAGSNITLFDSLKYLISIGVDTSDAIRSMTYIPAKAIGMSDSIGLIAEGHVADFLICDKDYNLINVFKSGNKIH